MFQLLIKIVAIGIKNFVLKSILYGGNHSPNSLNIMYSIHHMKSNMTQRLLLFPSNKHKSVKCKNTRIMIILMLNASIVIRPQNFNW
jgi:hypothetical protein